MMWLGTLSWNLIQKRMFFDQSLLFHHANILFKFPIKLSLLFLLKIFSDHSFHLVRISENQIGKLWCNSLTFTDGFDLDAIFEPVSILISVFKTLLHLWFDLLQPALLAIVNLRMFWLGDSRIHHLGGFVGGFGNTEASVFKNTLSLSCHRLISTILSNRALIRLRWRYTEEMLLNEGCVVFILAEVNRWVHRLRTSILIFQHLHCFRIHNLLLRWLSLTLHHRRLNLTAFWTTSGIVSCWLTAIYFVNVSISSLPGRRGISVILMADYVDHSFRRILSFVVAWGIQVRDFVCTGGVGATV